MSDSTFVSVGFDAIRVCEAIAKIGYEPYTAIMDLIDNSVTANASIISISIELRPGKTLKNRNSVARYQIIDNGKGMSHDEIINAFTLGSKRNYGPNSLSKYGMGLKSAGLSLGSKISITSKKDGEVSERYTFDLEEIERTNQLAITKTPLTENEVEYLNSEISGDSGSIVEISGCENVNQSSPGTTVTKLKDRLGVVYYSFLQENKKPIKIRIRTSLSDKQGEYEEIKPKDLLFTELASANTGWSLDSYDFTSPYLILDEDWNSLRDKDNNPLPPIKIQAVAFPQARMADEKSPLSPSDKLIIKSYGVSRENSGFFIYRNGRLIRWGDGLERATGKPLITKDDINIRIRFEIQDVHDDILHVDVSKQRLEIDDEHMYHLETIVSKAIRTAKEIRAACQEKLSVRRGEGETFSQSVKDVPEDDPQQMGKGEVDPETLVRQEKKNAEGQAALDKIAAENEVDGESSTLDTAFQKIRYSNKIPFGQVWKPYFDSKEGVFVCISKNHPFYDEYLNRFEDGSKERLTAEALIFACALAENNVFSYETEITQNALEKIFRRFHSNVNQFLQDWTWENTSED
ncbi:hypothetical protein PSCICE_31580 [Pseudomonas cichorii]|nr:ATP-binding protein [Pseudomonas cichorii]GFM51891.1 hypothetical protein PSCICE_31580 [Pseudomonas cichorii]